MAIKGRERCLRCMYAMMLYASACVCCMVYFMDASLLRACKCIVSVWFAETAGLAEQAAVQDVQCRMLGCRSPNTVF